MKVVDTVTPAQRAADQLLTDTRACSRGGQGLDGQARSLHTIRFFFDIKTGPLSLKIRPIFSIHLTLSISCLGPTQVTFP